MVLRAYLETGSPLYPRLESIRSEVAAASGSAVTEAVDWGMYRFPREEVLQIAEVLNLGIRQAVLGMLTGAATPAGLGAVMGRLFGLIGMALRYGVYRGGTNDEAHPEP
jgi:hypothetical protein